MTDPRAVRTKTFNAEEQSKRRGSGNNDETETLEPPAFPGKLTVARMVGVERIEE
jgi:hypothetical protein